MDNPGYLVVPVQILAINKARTIRNKIPDRFPGIETCPTDINRTIFQDMFPIVIHYGNFIHNNTNKPFGSSDELTIAYQDVDALKSILGSFRAR